MTPEEGPGTLCSAFAGKHRETALGFPVGGACETPDGSMAASHLHLVGVTIDHATKARAHAEAAEAICRQCPVLAACRAWSALSRWQSITVGAWTAPAHTDAYPPWSPWFCIGCGGDLPEHPDQRSGMWCLGCNQMRIREREQRWWGYTEREGAVV